MSHHRNPTIPFRAAPSLDEYTQARADLSAAVAAHGPNSPQAQAAKKTVQEKLELCLEETGRNCCS